MNGMVIFFLWFGGLLVTKLRPVWKSKTCRWIFSLLLFSGIAVCRFLAPFASQADVFPFTVKENVKVQWPEDDVCTLTYESTDEDVEKAGGTLSLCRISMKKTAPLILHGM